MNYTIYNIMSGAGFEENQMAWSLCWFVAPVLFFMAIFANKFMPDSSMQWSPVFAWIGMYASYLVVVSLFGLPMPALVAGMVGLGLGGYLGGLIDG